MPEHHTQHLYLLFDDWDHGFSIRKVSLSRRSRFSIRCFTQTGSDKQGVEASLFLKFSCTCSHKQGVQPVPQVFMHMRSPRGFPDLFTSAFGTKITAVPLSAERFPLMDVQEQALAFGPEACNYYMYPICFPVGDNKLFVLDVCNFDCYLRTPEDSSEEETWRSYNLARPPFDATDVSSYGVLPDGCILISTTKSTTFIFDTTTTKEEEYVWKPYGNWVLPFTGRGHYDTSLGGFVGLSEDGYLYCSTMAGKTTLHPASPDVKRTKNKVYTEGQHVSATLVHMRQGRFCLVECVSADNGRTGQELKSSWDKEFKLPPGLGGWDVVGGGPQAGRCMYRLMTFSLSYDTKGDCLKLTKCKARRYSLPHEARIGSVCMDPVAFWL